MAKTGTKGTATQSKRSGGGRPGRHGRTSGEKRAAERGIKFNGR